MAIPQTSPLPARQWPEQGEWTYQDWLQLPGDMARYEVIDGALYVTPPPSLKHQSSVSRLCAILINHADAHDLGTVYPSPVGVLLPNQPVPLEPDIVFVSKSHADILGEHYIEGVPDLVVEVLSPSNWPYDRQVKLRVYQDAAIPEYWILDYRAKTIEVLVLEEGEYVLQGPWGLGESASSGVLAGFQVAVRDVYRDILK
jgi:Uma2 family endonuclease